MAYVTLTWHACKYKGHKLHQRYILVSLSAEPQQSQQIRKDVQGGGGSKWGEWERDGGRAERREIVEGKDTQRHSRPTEERDGGRERHPKTQLTNRGERWWKGKTPKDTADQQRREMVEGKDTQRHSWPTEERDGGRERHPKTQLTNRRERDSRWERHPKTQLTNRGERLWKGKTQLTNRGERDGEKTPKDTADQ